MTDETQEQHPYEADDALNDRLYNVARKVDKILNRESMENHAAIIGMIQCSVARRSHEHEQKKLALQHAQQREQQEAFREAQRRQQFGLTQ